MGNAGSNQKNGPTKGKKKGSPKKKKPVKKEEGTTVSTLLKASLIERESDWEREREREREREKEGEWNGERERGRERRRERERERRGRERRGRGREKPPIEWRGWTSDATHASKAAKLGCHESWAEQHLQPPWHQRIKGLGFRV